MLSSKGTSKIGQQDNCNSMNQTTISILILVDELKYWKCDVCNGLLTMGDGNIELLGTQQRTAAVVCSSCSQKAPPKLAHKTTVTLRTRQQSLF
jgi:hypothetical protein